MLALRNSFVPVFFYTKPRGPKILGLCHEKARIYTPLPLGPLLTTQNVRLNFLSSQVTSQPSVRDFWDKSTTAVPIRWLRARPILKPRSLFTAASICMPRSWSRPRMYSKVSLNTPPKVPFSSWVTRRVRLERSGNKYRRTSGLVLLGGSCDTRSLTLLTVTYRRFFKWL